jgi:hypothetical protein
MLALRLACVAATAALALGWHTAPFGFVAAIYSLGFAHYLLALVYAAGQLRQIASAGAHWLSFAGLVLLGVTLYTSDFPLLVYFGIHHAANETYGRRTGLDAGLPAGLAAPLFAFHLAAYVAALRWSPLLAGIDQAWIWLGFGAAAAVLIAALRRNTVPIVASAPELSALALVGLSLAVNLSFLQVVFYHFALWAVLPAQRIYRRGGAPAVAGYVTLSAAAFAAAFSLSPIGPTAARLPGGWFTEQFLLWSYLHITLSVALSDAHPSWAVRLFRAAPGQPAALAPATTR